MDASIPHFAKTVAEIEENSWWAHTIGPQLRSVKFGYSIGQDGNELITEVPKEPLESLLLHVRRLTMNGSSEQLHVIRKALKRQATNDRDKHLLDVWHKYWRLAFIKEPFEIDQSAKHEVMTPYKVYHCFINGRYFHTNIPEYNVILYGVERLGQTRRPYAFFQNMFHWVVANLCYCAIAMDRFIKNGNTFSDMPLQGIDTVFAFIWWRNRVDQLDGQYKIFSDWIEAHGRCDNCRWS